MTDLDPASRTDSASRHVPARPEAVWNAFADPDALIAWLPPEGMRGRILAYEFRAGGRYAVELTFEPTPPSGGSGKTSRRTDVSRGRFLELVPAHRLVQSVEFDSQDPAFAGTMIMTWTFVADEHGTLVTVAASQVPSGIGASDHQAGMASSLANLARHLA